MNFIRKVFENKTDEDVHRQFKRFSKGTFNDRAIAEINVGNNIKIKTSFEYTNWFVSYLLNTAKEKIKVSGGIISTKDLKNLKLGIVGIKQFAGVKTYLVDGEIESEELKQALNNFPDALFCLSFSTEHGSLKVKVKSPKSAKPGKGGEEAKANYCVFTTKDKGILKEFAFDVGGNFKRFRVSHDFVIEQLVVPDEYKNDLEKARIYAKRAGKIVRKLNVDGNKSVKGKDFEA